MYGTWCSSVILKELRLACYTRPPSIPIKTHFICSTVYCCLPWSCEYKPKELSTWIWLSYSHFKEVYVTHVHNFWVSILQVQQQLEHTSRVLRPPLFCSSVCIQYNTRKWKSNEKQGRPMTLIMWMMSGGCDTNVEGVMPDFKYVHNKVVCYRSNKITRY